MVLFKVAPVFFLVLLVGAEKKIELQDIEEDNLKSEKQKEYDTSDVQNLGSGPGIAAAPLDFMKKEFFRFFDNSAPQHRLHKPNPLHQPQQLHQPTRFVQQYAVSEAPERAPVVPSKIQYSAAPQQAMVGYLSNVPMQIYLVPQYYNEAEQGDGQPRVQYTTGSQYTSAAHNVHGSSPVATFSSAPEAVQTQTNYVEVPTYVAPTAKTYVPQYSSAPVTYVSYAHQPAVAPAPTVAPVLTYQVPVVQYPAAVLTSHPTPKSYYQNTHYQDTNAVEEHEIDESPKEYSHTDITYSKAPVANFPRFYSARPPPREEYRHNHIQELPHPHSLLLKGSPSHLAHIPKALPILRPLNKPVYGGHPPPHPGVLAGRPSEHYGPFKRRPTSLLDSYIPSSVQIEYMKRGFTNDPLQAYEDLSNARHFSHAPAPRHFERGFLPNQMYHTGGGGVTFGHYKRASKVDKASHN